MSRELNNIIEDLEKIDLIDDFKIPIDSVHEFVESLRKHAIRHAECVKQAAIANRIKNEATLELEVIKSELVEEIMNKAEKKGKPIPPSAIQEVRRTMIPKDARYKKVYGKLIKATYAYEYLYGLTFSWSARDHRLQEIQTLMKKQLGDYEPSLYYREHVREEEQDKLNLDLDYR